MMKKILCMLLIALMLLAGSGLAEARYLLPGGWGYNADGTIYDPNGNQYANIQEAFWMLTPINWGYGDWDYMNENWLLDENGNPVNPNWYIDEHGNPAERAASTPELGDFSPSPIALGAMAMLAAAGMIAAEKKRRAC